MIKRDRGLTKENAVIEDVEREKRAVRLSGGGECGVIVEAEVVFEPENGRGRGGFGSSSRERANEGRMWSRTRREGLKWRERQRERTGKSEESHGNGGKT